MASKTLTIPDSARVAPGHLVSPHADGWLVGGLGIVVWTLFTASSWGGPALGPVVSGPLYWMLIAISGTHFGVSYHLAYGQGRAQVRERWIPLIAGPLLLALMAFAILAAAAVGADRFTNEGVRLMLVAVYTLTTWHYIKQVYGVARVGASLQGLSFDRTTVLILRYGLYPLWLAEAAVVWIGSSASFGGYAASYDILPSSIESVIRVFAYGAAALLAAAFVRISVTWGRRPPATVWTPYAVGFLWLLFPPSYASVVIVFAAFHALQYLACAHRAEVAWGSERAPGTAKQWWSSVFGGSLATGLLLVYWIPRWLSDSSVSSVSIAAPALLFAFFNLHHYLVDASIWRFGGDHITRIIRGPAASHHL